MITGGVIPTPRPSPRAIVKSTDSHRGLLDATRRRRSTAPIAVATGSTITKLTGKGPSRSLFETKGRARQQIVIASASRHDRTKEVTPRATISRRHVVNQASSSASRWRSGQRGSTTLPAIGEQLVIAQRSEHFVALDRGRASGWKPGAPQPREPHQRQRQAHRHEDSRGQQHQQRPNWRVGGADVAAEDPLGLGNEEIALAQGADAGSNEPPAGQDAGQPEHPERIGNRRARPLRNGSIGSHEGVILRW